MEELLTLQNLFLLILLAGVSFIQNMAFTWSGRSRNSGDPGYHRYAAWGSNGIWFVCNMINVKIMWEPLMSGDWAVVLLGGLVYTLSTAEGSVLMMKIMLKKEKGKRKVGSSKDA